MAWPSSEASTANVDSGADNPRTARADIDDALTKLNLIINSPAPYETRAALAAATVPSSANIVWTAGYSSRGDSPVIVYERVGAEPSHAFKVQSADLSWWEGIPLGGRVFAEWFGAVNGSASDNIAELDDALAYVASTGHTLVAKGIYGIATTLQFPSGTYGFEGPDTRDLTTGTDTGFIWIGGNNDTGIEVLDTDSCLFTGALIVNNRSTQATGFRGILFHNPNSSGSAISNCQFEFVGAMGANVGVQIGDFTNDTYDSNWEQNVIENLHCYEVANALIIDSNNQDNIQIHSFHNGGPNTLPAYVGTRSHGIHVKRNGNGLSILHGFCRLDGITANNAGVLIEDGSFSCGYLSFEGADPASLVHLNSTTSRDQSVLQKVVAPSHLKDGSSRSLRLGHNSGTVLIGCSVGGDIECSQPVMALGTVFISGSEFTFTGSGRVIEFGTQRRTSDGSALDSDYIRLDLRDGEFLRTERFASGTLNSGGTASETVVDNQSMAAGSMDEWKIAMENSGECKALYRLFIWRAAGGTITSDLVTDFDTGGGGTTVTVTDNTDGTYDIAIENTAANDKTFTGWLMSRDRFTI